MIWKIELRDVFYYVIYNKRIKNIINITNNKKLPFGLHVLIKSNLKVVFIL